VIFAKTRLQGLTRLDSDNELLKLERSGEFPDESVKIKDTQIHYVNDQTY
jgi:hypothetical protein